ncbi:MAG: hypothetical protein ACRD2C_08545 [Acidimicrobiales bacterium]
MTAGELERGVFVVSIDTELAWGLAHRRNGSGRVDPDAIAAHDLDREREVIEAMLDVFTRHEIAATWAIVGHLFLDHCTPGADGRPHPEVVRPSYPWLDGDWFDIDPSASHEEAPFYYGRDIVERIAACPVAQEIASHGFSHVMAGEPGCSAAVFASELAASQAVAARRGLQLRSFVYPRNSIGHRDELVAAGFSSYRGSRPAAFAASSRWSRRARALVDCMRPSAGSAVVPTREASGLWNIPQTYIFAPASSRRRLPPALWVRQPLVRLRQAARERSLFHLWFHPYNVTAAPERALDALERLCRAASVLRDQRRLDVVTMAQLSDRLSGLSRA